jgi:hypothetical protein
LQHHGHHGHHHHGHRHHHGHHWRRRRLVSLLWHSGATPHEPRLRTNFVVLKIKYKTALELVLDCDIYVHLKTNLNVL